MFKDGRVWVSPGWIAKRLGVSYQTIYRWINQAEQAQELTVFRRWNRAGRVRMFIPIDELAGMREEHAARKGNHDARASS